MTVTSDEKEAALLSGLVEDALSSAADCSGGYDHGADEALTALDRLSCMLRSRIRSDEEFWLQFKRVTMLSYRLVEEGIFESTEEAIAWADAEIAEDKGV